MENFNGFNLPKRLLKTLAKMKFSVPTPIQAQTIPYALGDAQDILGTARTGTGKTGAFAIPLAAKLLENKEEAVLVLTPTRELASQVITVFRQLLSLDRGIKMALLIGGDPIEKQFRQLIKNPRLLIGTPGRINDHLTRGTLQLDGIKSLVLDEMDLMLDMGFDVQIEKIIKHLTGVKQRLMFSATLPQRIEKLAKKYLQNPVRVAIDERRNLNKSIKQEVIQVVPNQKYVNLKKQLDARDGSIIIFVKTRNGASELAFKLNKDGYSSAPMHGSLQQSKRERTLKGFRNKKYRILVATDVMSRGIDVPHVKHVINYDLPQCGDDYIHRIGRTARAGAEGSALSLITKGDQQMWNYIQHRMDPNSTEHESKPRPKRKSYSKSRSKSYRKNKPFGSSNRTGYKKRRRSNG